MQHSPDCLRGPVRRTLGLWGATPEPSPSVPRPPDPDIRWELVERIRREIAAGTYETPEKLEKALRRLREALE
jgi:hypothetical protein